MADFMPFPVSLPRVMLALGIAVSLAGCDRQTTPDTQPAVEANQAMGEANYDHAGEPLPEFTFSDPDGNTLALASLKGTPTLINMWATWCAPCVLEMPMLDELGAEMDGKLRVITVSQDVKGAELVAPFFADKGFTKLEPWLDPDNDMAFHFQTGVLPTTILYDAQGKEVWRMIGDYEWMSEDAKALVAQGM